MYIQLTTWYIVESEGAAPGGSVYVTTDVVSSTYAPDTRPCAFTTLGDVRLLQRGSDGAKPVGGRHMRPVGAGLPAVMVVSGSETSPYGMMMGSGTGTST